MQYEKAYVTFPSDFKEYLTYMWLLMELLPHLVQDITKLILIFNFNMEDEIALFSISPTTHLPDKQWQWQVLLCLVLKLNTKLHF